MSDILAGTDVSDDPSRASPDRALVLEVIGPVADFVGAARAAGLEWLAEDVAPLDLEDDSEYDEQDRNLLYVTMPTLAGLNRMLALWRRYARGDDRPSDAREWWRLFGYLADVRTWSARDRVDPVVQRHIERILRADPGLRIRLELDLWYRRDAALRDAARTSLGDLMRTIGGTVLDFAVIPEIEYQAALVELPGVKALELAGLEGPLADADPVMRIRAQSLYASDGPDDDGSAIDAPAEPPPPDGRPPIVALLDGHPVQNHVLLGTRVDVVEVDVAGSEVPVARRMHGTAMASLILHGDLGAPLPELGRRLRIVPILAAPAGLDVECTPLDRLPIPLVNRAVKALADGLDGAAPLGARVVVLNHSVCDQHGAFAGRASPWAKLLDHLAHEHRLLFVVSAGNVREAFEMDTYADSDEFAGGDRDERQVSLLRSIERAKGTRLMLSPAESINALTVGALHEDEADGAPVGLVDPFDQASGVTNLASSVGLGVNRGMKPDVVEAGGRQLAASDDADGVLTVWAAEHPDVGQRVAVPDRQGRLDRLARTTGTSNAAALVTRAAVRAADAVEALFARDGQDWGTARTRAVVLKTLVVHGCAWGATFDLLDAIYPPAAPKRWARRREAISRFLGYGRPAMDRILSEAGHRATLLADDEIGHDERHSYRIPIPRAMIGNRELRRVVLTLAWSSPIDPGSTRYRGFALDIVNAEGKRAFWRGVGAVGQPHPDAARRGTVQHLVLEGENMVRADADGAFLVCVQARAALPAFEDETVPYALAVTLEMGQPIRQDLREDVLGRIRARTSVRPPVGVRDRVRGR